jgi:hypothetical protein
MGETMRLSILLLAAATLTANATSIAINPSNTTINVSDAIVLNVEVDGISDLYAFQIDLQFDPAIIEAVSVTAGSFLPNMFFIDGFIDNTAGSITGTIGTLLGPPPGITGSGALAQFTFQARIPGVSAVSLLSAQLLDRSSATV